MDYKVFYAEIADWIYESNHLAMKVGLDSSDFWQWVASSTGEMCNKYNNNSLVNRQMSMLSHWLEDVYLELRERKSNGL